MILNEEVRREQEQVISRGMQLAESKDLVLTVDRKRNKKIVMGDMLEGLAEHSVMRANTAILLENMRRFIANMDETTRMINIGDFERFAFQMIRVLFPNLALQDLASIQPMTQSIGLVFFTKYTYGLTKGKAIAGTDAFENPNQSYSSEQIDEEQIETGDGATVNFTGYLSYLPVKPGTITLTTVSSGVTLEMTDNGNGAFTGDVGGASTINYVTGYYDITWSAAPDATVAVNAAYSYNMEANATLPQIDAQIISSPVRATMRKLRTLWSLEAAQDLMDMHGEDIEALQASAMVAKLKTEIDREGIDDMISMATGSLAAWSKTPGAGVSYAEHKLSFIDKLIEGSNSIFNSTQLAVGNWIVAGINVSSLIESLPGFIPIPKPKASRGIYKVGRILDLDVWKDPTYQVAGVASPNAFLIGMKGEEMYETGYIHAPYIMAHTIKVELDDFIGRKAIASRYGKKKVNGKFYCKGTITT